MWNLQWFRFLLSKNSLIAVLALVVLAILSDDYKSHEDLKKTQVVYANPEIKTVERIVYKEGPVRIKTVTIKEDAREITTRVEEHGATEATTEAVTAKSPVPVNQVMMPTRTDRYLLTLGVNRLTPNVDGKALFAGYSIKNRVDIQVGGIVKDGFSPWLLVGLRF